MSLEDFLTEQIRENIPYDPFYAQFDARIIYHTKWVPTSEKFGGHHELDRVEWVGGKRTGISFTALAMSDLCLLKLEEGVIYLGELTLNVVAIDEQHQCYVVEQA